MTNAPSSHAAELDLLVEASLAAGREALKFFRNDVQVWWKNGGTSPVTAADHAANDILKARLLGARPGYGWLSEESEDNDTRLSQDRVFIVDPIDGTRAFMTGKDTWCVSAALTENGRSIAGVLFAPSLDELYIATADGRVEKNGKALRVAAPDAGGRVRISAADDMINALAQDMKNQVERISRIPSLAYRLAMIADGRMDATLVKPNAHDWDLAAAHLILRNAGGLLTDSQGNEPIYNGASPQHGVLVAASAGLHSRVMGALPSGLA
ncbi:MAG: 3(2),5-bisphosphate nucleotidase CysQ [Rhizobium sp.]|nr:3(2),5-bisphosphate nucleotidase CysQ [Rhizobium sp.]